MIPRLLSFTVLLALAAPVAALAQGAVPLSTPDSVAANAVGHWLYDERGRLIGSVRALSDDGASAQILLGSYFQPSSRQITVPAGSLALVGGKVTLRRDIVEALNKPIH